MEKSEISDRNQRAKARAAASVALQRKLYPSPTPEETARLMVTYGTCKAGDCANCKMNCGMGADGYSLERRLPCGQYNCEIRIVLHGR